MYVLVDELENCDGTCNLWQCSIQTGPCSFRPSSSFSRVLFTLDSARLTVPTQSSGWTPISIHSLVGGGVVREGDLYKAGTQRRRKELPCVWYFHVL